VGASPTPGALGASVLANLERLGYDGTVHLINPKRSEIGGRPCLASVDELPMGVDVAVLAIPRVAVLDTVKALVRRDVGAAIIFSAGFAEGGAAGLAEQREIARIAGESGMVVDGPNCLGFVNHADGIALTFVETPAVALGEHPGIGIVSQSGAMAAVLGVMLASRALGLSYSISTGNEAASGVEDYVEYLLADTRTRVIGMIVEQFRDPARFLELAARARAQGKLIVLLHPGRSTAARESAATHTGALAGDYALMRAKVESHGVLLVESLEELGDVCEVALRCSPLPSGGTVLVTESGAFKALALDLCEQIGLALPKLTDQDSPTLRTAMPDFVPVSNPLDLTAQTLVDPGLYRRVLAALMEDSRCGSILLGIIQTDATTCALKFPAIIAAIRELVPAKPVLFAGLDEGAVVPQEYIHALRTLGIPYFPSAERAMRALARFAALAARAQVEPETVAAMRASTAPMELVPGVIPEYRAQGATLENRGPVSGKVLRADLATGTAGRAAARFPGGSQGAVLAALAQERRGRGRTGARGPAWSRGRMGHAACEPGVQPYRTDAGQRPGGKDEPARCRVHRRGTQ
jgi:acyl-CoA synthetase (NDP forming)